GVPIQALKLFGDYGIAAKSAEKLSSRGGRESLLVLEKLTALARENPKNTLAELNLAWYLADPDSYSKSTARLTEVSKPSILFEPKNDETNLVSNDYYNIIILIIVFLLVIILFRKYIYSLFCRYRNSFLKNKFILKEDYNYKSSSNIIIKKNKLLDKDKKKNIIINRQNFNKIKAGIQGEKK
ncbi:MAG: hypothetical protein LBR11_00070, partial [Deltaproteobacteria bacterium]|nr:hypothetical protein [Deltaproteobacteria bacterium]